MKYLNRYCPPALWLCASLWAAPVSALTGDELYKYCQSEPCGGYFVGAFDAVRLSTAIAGESKDMRADRLRICPPTDVTDEEVVERALKYLEQHPGQRHLGAANLSLRAWKAVWPCR